MMQIFTILYHWHMDSISFWTNISGMFSTIVFSFVIFLLFSFLAWCSCWCFIYHSLHPKKSALLLCDSMWLQEKHGGRKRSSKLLIWFSLYHLTFCPAHNSVLINTPYSIKIFSVLSPKLNISCFVSAITTKLQISFYFNLLLTLTEFTLH